MTTLLRDPPVRPPAVRLSGLCTTCVHAGGCGIRRDSEGGVWRCEEFDSGPVRPPASSAAPVTPLPVVTARGLCANCEFAATCGHARSEGVWHCEWYR